MFHQSLSQWPAPPPSTGFRPGPALVSVIPKPPAAAESAIAPRYPASSCLARGTQKRLIDAATFSVHLGTPVNTLITVDAARLQSIDGGGIIGLGHLWDGFQDLLERLRKWTTGRNVPWACLWVREVSGRPGEHWHLALHLPARHRLDLAHQLAAWTDEPLGDGSLLQAHDVAVSALGSWHVTARRRGGRGPEGIAAYLGKAEPGRIKLYGKTHINHDKPRPQYRGGEGNIEGKRHGISRTLGRTAQRAAGWTA
jgi:hypothetical protein